MRGCAIVDQLSVQYSYLNSVFWLMCRITYQCNLVGAWKEKGEGRRILVRMAVRIVLVMFLLLLLPPLNSKLFFSQFKFLMNEVVYWTSLL